MFPANFDYYRAGSLAEAVTLLQRHPGAKILAGGHSLVPAMKLRVSNPPALVDIGRIADLKSITVANGQLTVGALCTHAEIANSQAVKDNCGVLAQAAGQIGDQMIRTRARLVDHWPMLTQLPITQPSCVRWAGSSRFLGRVACAPSMPIASSLICLRQP